MASPEAESRQSRPLLDLGRVNRLRVRVGFGQTVGGPAYDVFFLDVPGTGAADTFDEAPYVEALEPLLSPQSATPRLHSVQVTRRHTNWGVPAGELEIHLDVTSRRGRRGATSEAVEAITEAFRHILDKAVTLDRSDLRRDEAIARAITWVAEAYPDLSRDSLSVSDEEHRAAQGSWSVGLRTRELDRYVVVVGFLDGYAGSAYLSHQPRSEVLDSVGVES